MMGECGIAVSGSLRSIKPLRTIKSYPFEQVDTSVPQCMPAKDATRLKRFVTPPGLGVGAVWNTHSSKSKTHYRIRWSDSSLDWKPFPTEEEASQMAEWIPTKGKLRHR